MRFRAMGTEVLVLAIGGPPSLPRYARSRIEGLERRWSRFLPDSELSRLNSGGRASARGWGRTPSTCWSGPWRGGGSPAAPSTPRSTTRWSRPATTATSTRCAARPAPARRRARLDRRAARGCRIDRASRRVELAPGVRIDLGAIAKGHAADVVTGELCAMGARGALVSVGGDLRARGEAEDGHGWVIAIEDPFRTGGEVARVALADGAVATSSRVRRAWRRDGRPAHHADRARGGAPGLGRPRPGIGDHARLLARGGARHRRHGARPARRPRRPGGRRRDRPARGRRWRAPPGSRPRGAAGVNDQLWWEVARASGIVSWALLSVAVILGLLLASRIGGKTPPPAWLLDLHRMLGGLTLSFVGRPHRRRSGSTTSSTSGSPTCSSRSPPTGVRCRWRPGSWRSTC